MPFPPATSPRVLKHSRVIQIDAYARADDLWDIDARISDTKTSDFELVAGVRPAGQPIHDLGIRITFNTDFTIIAASAISTSHPYPGYCQSATPAYQKLVGLNLLKQFRQEVKLRLGGILGCTHITELTQVLPTAAIQAFAGDVIKFEKNQSQQPFQLDKCHTLALDSEAVATYYPRWAKVKTPDK